MFAAIAFARRSGGRPTHARLDLDSESVPSNGEYTPTSTRAARSYSSDDEDYDVRSCASDPGLPLSYDLYPRTEPEAPALKSQFACAAGQALEAHMRAIETEQWQVDPCLLYPSPPTTTDTTTMTAADAYNAVTPLLAIVTEVTHDIGRRDGLPYDIPDKDAGWEEEVPVPGQRFRERAEADRVDGQPPSPLITAYDMWPGRQNLDWSGYGNRFKCWHCKERGHAKFRCPRRSERRPLEDRLSTPRPPTPTTAEEAYNNQVGRLADVVLFHEDRLQYHAVRYQLWKRTLDGLKAEGPMQVRFDIEDHTTGRWRWD